MCVPKETRFTAHKIPFVWIQLNGVILRYAQTHLDTVQIPGIYLEPSPSNAYTE